MIRGIRGAATVDENKEEQIIETAKQLVGEMINKNNINPANVASVFISLTPDLNAAFPAKVLRMFPNWDYVPVMCMQEISVPGSLPRCIRLMIHVNTTKEQTDIHHVYLGRATVLRPDLQKQTID